MRIPIPRLYLGTMTFGWTSQTSSIVDEPVALEMIRRFVKINTELGLLEENEKQEHYIDTARIYSGGKTEPIVGAVLSSLTPSESKNIVIGTKAHPSQEHGLSPKGIQSQLSTSFSSMNIPSCKEYYLHQPDTQHSLLDSLKYTHELIQSNQIEIIGMSNYHYTEMKRAFELCEKHNLTKPRVYQGLYNPLNRMVEEDLIPLLREHGCAFVAYNPLAAGLLSGKHSLKKKDEKEEEEVKKGRFWMNPNYLPRFYTEKNFEALDKIRSVCEKEGWSMIEATFFWLLRHSALDVNRGDGVLLGASSLDQLDENLKACLDASDDKKCLSEEMLKVFDEAWEITKDGAFPYWRSYSLDMPNRDSLDQGASYSATKK